MNARAGEAQILVHNIIIQVKYEPIKNTHQTPLMPKSAAASHILVRTEKDAKSIAQQLRKGSDFAQLAKKHSTCPSKKKGGDLGEFKKGTMVKQFDQAVFANGSEDKPFLGPIKTKFGYHLIQVMYKS